MWFSYYAYAQQFVSIPVKMEGTAVLLTLAPVMWGGQEQSVNLVSERLRKRGYYGSRRTLNQPIYPKYYILMVSGSTH